MSRLTREQWLLAAYRLLDEGRIPADVPLSVLCKRLGVTKGSFYAHFPKEEGHAGGAPELDAEVITRWERESGAHALEPMMAAVHDPLDRLRLLRTWALERAVRDGTMRRWAARDPAAAAAVGAADTAITGHVTQALRDLGFSPPEAAVLAGLLVSAFVGAYHSAATAPDTDPATFDALLGILLRAAATGGETLPGGVATAPGTDGDRAVLFRVAPQLPAAAIRQLAIQATQFARELAAEEDDPPGDRGHAEPATSEVTGA